MHQWYYSGIHISDSPPAAGVSGVMDDCGQCQWPFPPGCPRPCHTLLDVSLLFVSGSDAGGVQDCCLCRKCIKRSGGVTLHRNGDGPQHEYTYRCLFASHSLQNKLNFNGTYNVSINQSILYFEISVRKYNSLCACSVVTVERD